MDIQKEAAVGIDIGGTKINIGLVDRAGTVLLQETLPTLARERRVTEQLRAGLASVLAAAAGACPDHRIIGVGIGSAGQIDFHAGTVHFASDLIPGYTGTPLREIAQSVSGLPAYVDNDVNVLALAEKYFGAGRDARDVVCVALGTGVGGAVLADGKLVHGVKGGAGEIGHLSVDFRGPTCICGGIGCLELYASGTGIARMYGERTGEREHTAKEVVARWLGGEAAAAEVMGDAIAALATAIASLVHTFNPEKVVVGGGLADIGEPLFAPLRAEVDSRTMPSMRSAVTIEPAVMGNLSGMVGAAMQVWEYGGGAND